MERMSWSMRRKKQALSQAECYERMQNASSGVLSVIDTAGLPYGIPLNFALDKNQLIFHGALKGHKMDALKVNPHVCFTVIVEEKVLPEHLSTHYCSIIAFGTIKIIEDEQLKKDYLMTLGKRFLPHDNEKVVQEIKNLHKATAVFVLEIEHLTGKVDKRSIKMP